MTTTIVRGDVFLTTAQSAAIGLNASGGLGVSALHTALLDRYPVFVSEYRRRGRAGLFVPGDMWLWTDSQPWLLALMVRETPQSIMRLRYVESALLKLAQNWQREGIRSLAFAPWASDGDWPLARELIIATAERLELPIVIYDRYIPGEAAETPPASAAPDESADR